MTIHGKITTATQPKRPTPKNNTSTQHNKPSPTQDPNTQNTTPKGYQRSKRKPSHNH
jgi:hypothetical protein